MVASAQTRWFVAGLYVGSAAVATVLSLVAAALGDLGVPDGPQTAAALGLALALIVLRAVRPGSLPQNRRQVPAWVTETHPAGFAIFGAEMGTGMRTYAPTVLPHVVAATVLAGISPLAAACAAVGFATGRALMIPLYRYRTRDGQPYVFRVPRWLELGTAVAMVGTAALLLL